MPLAGSFMNKLVRPNVIHFGTHPWVKHSCSPSAILLWTLENLLEPEALDTIWSRGFPIGHSSNSSFHLFYTKINHHIILLSTSHFISAKSDPSGIFVVLYWFRPDSTPKSSGFLFVSVEWVIIKNVVELRQKIYNLSFQSKRFVETIQHKTDKYMRWMDM